MKQLITLAAVFAAFTVTAQNVGINTDGSTPTMMLDIKTSAASGDNGILINNTAATADAFIQLQVDATPLWTLGVDDSDADEFKIARSTALGTSNAFTINSNRQLLSTIDGTESVPAWSFETDVNTGIWQNNADELMISAGGREFLTLDEGGATNNVITFNIDGDDMDFRIESDDQPNQFFIDGNSNEIGIRTAAPAYLFHMSNNGVNIGATAMAVFDNAGTNGVSLTGLNQSTGNVYNGMEGITYGTYSGAMGLGITTGAGGDGILGSTNDWQSIGVVGTRFNSGGADTGYGGLFLNDLGYTGGLFNVSDRRLKKNIEAMENALDVIKQLAPVTYNFDLEKYPNLGLNSGLEYGFIAQEVQAIVPDIVREKTLPTNGAAQRSFGQANNNMDENFLTMDYSRLIPILTKALQEQQVMIEDLQKEIESLKND